MWYISIFSLLLTPFVLWAIYRAYKSGEMTGKWSLLMAWLFVIFSIQDIGRIFDGMTPPL